MSKWISTFLKWNDRALQTIHFCKKKYKEILNISEVIFILSSAFSIEKEEMTSSLPTLINRQHLGSDNSKSIHHFDIHLFWMILHFWLLQDIKNHIFDLTCPLSMYHCVALWFMCTKCVENARWWLRLQPLWKTSEAS